LRESSIVKLDANTTAQLDQSRPQATGVTWMFCPLLNTRNSKVSLYFGRHRPQVERRTVYRPQGSCQM